MAEILFDEKKKEYTLKNNKTSIKKVPIKFKLDDKTSRFRKEILKKETDEKNKKIAYAILGNALQAPVMQILDNAGYHINDVYPEWDIKFGEGYNVATEKFGNMMKMGVIDPMKVTKSALQNAVSVAVTLLSTNAIITMARTYDTE